MRVTRMFIGSDINILIISSYFRHCTYFIIRDVIDETQRAKLSLLRFCFFLFF